ncbi:hypothetical protein ACWDV4_24540 [Micromonospora sp. NPDC003197]
MFGIGRRKTHSQLAKAELNESLDHFRRAATHAAGGVGATLGPRMNAARDYVGPTATKVKGKAVHGWAATVTALAPLAVAAAEGARHAGSTAQKVKPKNMRAMRKKESLMARRRWPMLTGILAIGTVAGVAGAAAVRRRRQQDWDAYDAGRALESVREDAEAMAAGSTSPLRSESTKTSSGSSNGTAPQATDKPLVKTAEKAAEKTADRPSPATLAEATRKSPAKNSDGVLGSAGTATSNSRN